MSGEWTSSKGGRHELAVPEASQHVPTVPHIGPAPLAVTFGHSLHCTNVSSAERHFRELISNWVKAHADLEMIRIRNEPPCGLFGGLEKMDVEFAA